MKKAPTHILVDAGLRKTSIRIRVLQLLLQKNVALSSQELESHLKGVDRITLYRTLRSFEQKGIIHQINDGTQSFKYALCQEACDEHQHLDQHVHFHCINCGITVCLIEVQQPLLRVPKGFVVKSSQMTLQGSCPDCTILGIKNVNRNSNATNKMI